MNDDLKHLLTHKKVIVCLGAGGVGKTTMSIAISTMAAKLGLRVALLSIDPAKRLAAALGIELENQLSKIAFPDELEIRGSVYASMLDQKAVFDAMVYKHSPSAIVSEKILDHPLYKAASTNLSGPLEYMALAKLQELTEDGNYDLVVLDTPPDTHALDFLARPNVLAGFMENKVMNWLIKPFVFAGRLGLGRLMSVGERLMGGLASITGFSALRSLSEFLVLIQDIIEGFHKSGEQILKILHEQTTAFVLVTVPTFGASRSAENIGHQLTNLDYQCDLLLINKNIPTSVASALEHLKNTGDEAIKALNQRMDGEITVTQGLHKKLSTDNKRLTVLSLPELDFELQNAEAISRVATILMNNP